MTLAYTKLCVSTAFCLMLTLISAFPRIGETTAQCDQRYGEPTFTNAKGDLECRFYNFNQTRIQVIFQDSVSTVENFFLGPQHVAGQQEIRQFSSDSLGFFRGLLSSAYSFSEAQLTELSKIRQVSAESADSGTAVNGSVRASCGFRSDEEQSTIKFLGSVTKLDKRDVERIVAFQGENILLEGKNRERARAKGF